MKEKEIKKPEPNVVYTFFFFCKGKKRKVQFVFDEENERGRYVFFNLGNGATTDMSKARFDFLMNNNTRKEFPPRPINSEEAPKKVENEPVEMTVFDYERRAEEHKKRKEESFRNDYGELIDRLRTANDLVKGRIRLATGRTVEEIIADYDEKRFGYTFMMSAEKAKNCF